MDRNDVTEETQKKWENEQNELKQRLVCDDTEVWQKNGIPYDGLQYIGGVDISFVKTSTTQACASLIICNYPDLEVIYEDCDMIELTAPYISGFLAFREVDFFLKLLEKLKESQPQYMPQVIMVDGNGILHPRGFGTASHLGVLADIPCIGVAKKLMQIDGLEKNSQHAAKIAELTKGGDSFPLIGDSGKVWGRAVRSCDKSSNPIYVSVGHRIHLDTAVRLIHLCSLYRIPEPIRQITELTKGGDSFPLIGDSGKVWGRAVRSCDKSSNPIYVSVGHRIHLDTAVRLIHICSLYRIPEPIRQADIRSREFLRVNVPEEKLQQKKTPMFISILNKATGSHWIIIVVICMIIVAIYTML